MSKVSRSVYQKLVEENKKLMADIRLLVEEDVMSPEKILCVSKWRNKFEKEKQQNKITRIIADIYIQNNKEELPEFIYKFKNKE